MTTPPGWYGQALTALSEVGSLSRFFIVGCQKSGTTWLQLFCNSHPRLACRGEGHYSDVLVPLLTDAFSRFNEQGKANHKLLPEDLLTACRVLIDVQMHRYLPADPVARGHVTAVGDKTPEGATALPVLDRLYPGSRFVHIVRDGRDCVVSGWAHLHRLDQADRFRNLAEYTRFFLERHWVPYVTLARQTGAALGDRYLELQYEQMLADPEGEGSRLLAFLGVDSTPGEVRACVERASFERLSGGRERGIADPSSHYRKGVAGDWKGVLDEPSLACFEEIAGGLARELGYGPEGLVAA